MGRVTDPPAASPATAALHFAARLALETDPSDVHDDLAAGATDFVVVDCRSSDAYTMAHVPGAVSFPHREITAQTARERLGEPGAKTVVCYCAGVFCNAADKGALRLAQLGYPVKVMLDGFNGWKKEGYRVEGKGSMVVV